MMRAALALVVVACSSSANDFPARPGGGGGVVVTGGGGGVVDAGLGDAVPGDGAVGDGGVPISGRVCIVKDLRTPAVCDAAKDASGVKVTLGTRMPTAAPAKTGEFTILAELGTALVWHATGTNFVTTVMPFGIDNTIPIVPDTLYTEMQSMNNLTILAEGQGSVLARVVSGGISPVAGVAATSTLVSGNIIPLYDTKDALIWGVTGPTQTSGAIWFPGVDVTTTSAKITFTLQGVVTPVTAPVNVEDQSITFITQDVQ